MSRTENSSGNLFTAMSCIVASRNISCIALIACTNIVYKNFGNYEVISKISQTEAPIYTAVVVA
jgi:hypothetical protein